MIVLRRTEQYGRRQLRITRHGVFAEYQRPQVGGGYYTRVDVFVPFPWRKTS